MSYYINKMCGANLSNVPHYPMCQNFPFYIADIIIQSKWRFGLCSSGSSFIHEKKQSFWRLCLRQFFGFSAKFQAENKILGNFRQFQAILGNFRHFQVILGHFRPFLGQIFRHFFAKKAITATQLVFRMYAPSRAFSIEMS